MDEQKLSQGLAERLERAGTAELVELVVELHPASGFAAESASRDARIAAARDAFGAASSPVERAIRSAGGEVVDSAWINQTLRARVPASAVTGLAALGEVRLLDVPRRLAPDRG